MAGGGGGGGGRKFIYSSSRVIGYRCSVPNIELEGTHSHFIVCVRPDDDTARPCRVLCIPALRCTVLSFFGFIPPTTARARNDVWTSFASMMMTIPLITITTILFFPRPLRPLLLLKMLQIFPISLTHLHRFIIWPGPLTLPVFGTTLLLLPFWLYDPTDPDLSLVSFHLHPFTLSLSYDYFLLPRICTFQPLTTLTTRASTSSSFKSTHSLPLLSLSLSLIYLSTHTPIPGPFRFRRIRDTTNNHAQVRYASTSYCTRSTGSTLYTCSALPCSMSLRRVN